MTRITVLLITILLFAGCGSYMTEVWINKDSSGEAKVTIDAGEMIDDLGMIMQQLGDSEEDSDLMGNTDSFFGEGKFDSVMVMYDMAPDSIKQTMNNPELLKNMVIRMTGDSEKREAIISMGIKYASEQELAALFQEFADMQNGAALGGGMGGNDMSKMFGDQTVDYENGVVRIKKEDSMEELKELGLFDDDSASFLDSLRLMIQDLENDGEGEVSEFSELGFVKMMFDTDVKTVYYLPGKVQFTNEPNAIVDGNTATFYDNFWDLILSGGEINNADRIIKYEVK